MHLSAPLSTSPGLRPLLQTQLRPPFPVKTTDKPEALNMALPHVKIKNKILQNGIILVQMLKIK